MGRYVNCHTSAIDGVPPKGIGTFDPRVVKGLIDAGHLVSVDGEGAPPAPREGEGRAALIARFDAAYGALQARCDSLRAENDRLHAELETATAPSSKTEG